MSLATAMRESVRSSRRANFYITENSFIDHYARDVGPAGVAVYHALERHVNCETRSTWVSTKKIAELLNLSQRTVQRTLKMLEDFRLIRIIRTENMTTYVIVPVPAKGRMAPIPLFDDLHIGDMHVAATTSVSSQTTSASHRPTTMSPFSDTHDAPNKEEQNLLNNTVEQDQSGPSTSRALTEKVVALLSIPATDNNLKMVQAALEAEKSYTGQPLEEVAALITQAAIEDRKHGIAINKFYFEDTKWRHDRKAGARYGINKAEQRKLDNLEANARIKQRLRDRLQGA
jgi:DNA-binding MarR family transcriptional regulator